MLTKLLGLEQVGPVTYLEWFLRSPLARWVLLPLLLVAVAFTAWLYWRETSVSRGKRIGLGVARGVLFALVLIMLFEPVFGVEMLVKLRRSILVLVDASESMNIADARASEREVQEAAMALGKMPFGQAAVALPADVRARAARATRIELARGILDNPNLDIFERLAEDYRIRYFSFGERVEPASGEGEELAAALRGIAATGKATRLGSAIEDVVARYSGQPIAGIVVLTDGASNEGLEPLEVARQMGERGIPIFPVGIGLPNPPDVRLEGVVLQDNVFARDKVPVRFRVASEGYSNRTVEVSLRVNGQEADRKQVVLGAEPQFGEMTFVPPEDATSLKVELECSPLPGEVASENNRTERTVRVIADKIKVLYVEGKPRWEYRYLRAVLLRDHRLEVKFLLTQGDRDLARASERYLERFPDVASEAFVFDLVVLGDVPATYFTPAQFARMEELVRERGGSFLLLAGQFNALAGYLGTPVADMLPVKLQAAGWEQLDETIHPVVTSKGDEMTVVTLEMPQERNAALWRLVRPLYQVPVLDGAKPAATVLATLSDAPRRREPYPLIAWQRYGRGKAMFVGTDQLWRLRFKRGDKYHARFWGQVIRFLTLSRLLGENKRIQLQSGRRNFRTGDRIQVFANVLDESYQPVALPSYTIYVGRQGESETTMVRLEPVRDVPGLYQGYFTPREEGHYVVTTGPADRAASNQLELEVVTTPLEKLQPAMQEDTLRKMAELSGGKYFAIGDLPDLPDQIHGEVKTAVVRREKPLWDLPLVFVVVLLCAGTEWFFRRKHDLI